VSSFEVSGPIEADVAVGVGLVEVIATDRTDAVVEVSGSRPGRGGDVSLAREAVVSYESGRLKVRVPRRRSPFGQKDSVDVRIELPSGSQLTVESAYGSVRASGELGDCRITAKYGNVTAETVGDLVLDAPYGTSEVTEVTGQLETTTGHGHLRIERVGGDARLRGAHGTIELGTTAGNVDVATSGPLTIERSLGDVTARSAHGKIRIREATGGSIQLENGYAEIDVGVASGVSAWIDAVSSHGRVRNELTPDPEAAANDRVVELRLRANWADILIRRAKVASRKDASQ